jgi:ABC-type phosphate transport system substrate-binding protein
MNTPKKLLLAALSCACAWLNAAEKITLAGSDLIKPYIADSAKSIAAKNGIELEVDMEGTFAAYDKLKSGKADIAIIALPRTRELPEGLVALPFAYQAAVVIVNSVNPIEEISTAQLSDIYSIATPNRAETWSQLGVKNIGLRNIMPIMTNLSDNVVVELFKYTAIDGMNLGQWVHIADNKTAIYNLIKANNSAIAVIGKHSERGESLIKVVSVAKSDKNGKKTYAFRPDRENIFNGDYPLTLPFYVVFKKENSEKIKGVARILLGDDIAQKIDKSDFFSAPSSSRKKSIFDLDIPR